VWLDQRETPNCSSVTAPMARRRASSISGEGAGSSRARIRETG
jgi:hypothetical protein